MAVAIDYRTSSISKLGPVNDGTNADISKQQSKEIKGAAFDPEEQILRYFLEMMQQKRKNVRTEIEKT